MNTYLIPVKIVYVSPASAHRLVFSGRKYDYFLHFILSLSNGGFLVYAEMNWIPLICFLNKSLFEK